MIKQLVADQPFTDADGKLPFRTKEWARLVTELDVLEGDGSPEGVIESKTRRFYMDNGVSGTTGNILYIKKLADISGDRTMGWILV